MPIPSRDKTRVCKRCGREYHPTSSRQMYCNQTITIKCEYCGREFETICGPTLRSTCSTECQAALVKQKRESSAASTTKICKWCGKEFRPKSARDVYCYDTHYQTCEVCGKQFEIDPRKDPYVRSCSPECKKILQVKNRDFKQEHENMKKALLEKYGVDNPMKIKGTKERIEATNMKKYGKAWYTQTDEYKDRVEQTDLEKYGVVHHLSNKDVIEKRKETVLQKYGVDNVSKSDGIKQKIKSTWNQKYGLDNISQKNVGNIEAWNQFIADPRQYILDNYSDPPTLTQLAIDLGVCLTSVYTYLDVKSNWDIVKKSWSRMEDEVVEFLKSLDSDIEIQLHNRTLIYPEELDIYLPKYKLAIECNPTYTHNSSIPDGWSNYPKPSAYHKNKTDRCENIGIRLIHIFGYEWRYKRPIIQSILQNDLKLNTRKLYARNCSIKDVRYNEMAEFLQQNHRQGFATASNAIGLYVEDELVSLMTFSKARNSISSKNSECDTFELVRFCNKLNTTVVGAASKLFKHFISDHPACTVLSFSDRAHTSGNLYRALGFTENSNSGPGYVWVDTKTDRAYNRVNAQKQNIKKFLNDDSIDLSKTEKQIMEEHGFVQVFDSGVITWIYR